MQTNIEPPAFAEPNAEVLTITFVRNELRSRISRYFYGAQEALEFFGDVGPLNGCDYVSDTLRQLTDRSFHDFAPRYKEADGRAVPAEKLAYAHLMQRRDLLSRTLRSQIDAQLDLAEVKLAAGEVLDRALKWAADHEFRGKNLGYNRAGNNFWASNPATSQLVCATPQGSRADVVKGWRDEATEARI